MSEQVPEGWTKTQLHELLTVPRKEKETKPETIELLTVKLHGQGIVRSGKFPKPTPNGRPYFKRLTGELLIGRQNLHNGGLGLVTKETSGLIASNAISSFVNRASSDLNFIHQLLSTEGFQKQIDTLSSGTGQKETSEKQILSCGVVVPPPPEQKKIASILTSVDEVIENTQKQIDKLQDLKKATMNELLTKGIGHIEFKDSELGKIPKSWEVVTTGDLFAFKNGLNKEKDAFGKGQRIVNYMDVFTHPEIKDYNLYGRVELSKSETDRFSVRKDDVFFTRTSETSEEIGLSSVITKVSEEVCFSGFVLRGRPVTSMLFPPLSGYLYRCNYVRQQIVSTCSYTTRALTNGTSLGKVLVAVPSYNEQKFIHASITAISENISQLDEKLNKFKSLKKSLMQDLLTGKVRVQVN